MPIEVRRVEDFREALALTSDYARKGFVCHIDVARRVAACQKRVADEVYIVIFIEWREVGVDGGSPPNAGG